MVIYYPKVDIEKITKRKSKHKWMNMDQNFGILGSYEGQWKASTKGTRRILKMKAWRSLLGGAYDDQGWHLRLVFFWGGHEFHVLR